jgi:hypothetical protein
MIGLEEIYQICPNNKFLLDNFLMYLEPLELIKMIYTCKYFETKKTLIYNIITPLVYDIMRQSHIDAYSYFHYKVSLKLFNACCMPYLPFQTYNEYSTVMSNIINNNAFIRKRFKIKHNQKVKMWSF